MCKTVRGILAFTVSAYLKRNEYFGLTRYNMCSFLQCPYLIVR